jgi:hypothetical protein
LLNDTYRNPIFLKILISLIVDLIPVVVAITFYFSAFNVSVAVPSRFSTNEVVFIGLDFLGISRTLAVLRETLDYPEWVTDYHLRL